VFQKFIFSDIFLYIKMCFRINCAVWNIIIYSLVTSHFTIILSKFNYRYSMTTDCPVVFRWRRGGLIFKGPPKEPWKLAKCLSKRCPPCDLIKWKTIQLWQARGSVWNDARWFNLDSPPTPTFVLPLLFSNFVNLNILPLPPIPSHVSFTL
jgi:hypothetical protein